METFACNGPRQMAKWATVMPHSTYPCISDKFCILNIEFFLHFENALDGVWKLTMYLKKKLETASSAQDVQVTAYMMKQAGYLVNLGLNVAHFEPVCWDCSEFILKRKEELPTDNSITFIFTFDVMFTDMGMIEKAQSPEALPNNVLAVSPSQNLSADMEDLRRSKEHADVELRSWRLTVPAHRCILSARSPLFAAMFRNKVPEKNSGVLHIGDMGPVILMQFLQYLYSDKIDNLTVESAMELYRVGCTNWVVSLKRKCARFLADNLRVDLCYPVLLMAHKFEDPDLFGEATNFIVRAGDILKSNEWQRFASEHPAVADKVYKFYHDEEDYIQHRLDILRLQNGDKKFVMKWF